MSRISLAAHIASLVVTLAFCGFASGCDGGLGADPSGGKSEICDDGIDNDGNGDIDCDDAACATAAVCKVALGQGLAAEGEGAAAGEGEGAAAGEGEGEGAAGEGEGEGAAGEGEGAAAGEGEGEGEGEGGVVDPDGNGVPPTLVDVYVPGYTGSISPGADVDCVSIDLLANQRVQAQLFDAGGVGCDFDSILTLFDSDGVTQVGVDDDDPRTNSLCSYLDATAQHDGTFFYCITAFDATDGPFSYELDVSICGNDVVERNETCDGSDLDGTTCIDGGDGVGVPACISTCDTFDFSQCPAPFCNDGARDGGEACEGNDLGGNDCSTIGAGFGSGTLACDGACNFDTSQCAAPFCGDGSRNGAEQCEGGDLGGNSCVSLGFASGSLSCDGACAFDTSQCAPPICGDGLRNAGDQCDGNDFGGDTCATFGFASGSLACNADCSTNTSACSVESCGNNVVDGSDACDGADLAFNNCNSIGFDPGGTLSCAPTCEFDVSACLDAACGDSVLGQFEDCDDGNALGGDGCSANCRAEVACPAGSALIEIVQPNPLTIADVTTQASTIHVAASGVITNAFVRINELRHTFDADLVLTLQAPSGAQVILANRNGNGGDDFLHTLFADQCARDAASANPPYSGCLRPVGGGVLSSLDGVSASGDWQLIAADEAGSDSGVLHKWTLDLCVQ